MVIGFFTTLIISIICVTIIFLAYMDYCSANKVKMFANPRYDERIRELEKEVEELRKKL